MSIGGERLFIAAWPSRPVMDALGALDRPRVDGVRWTTADQWHVTLRFLGRADPETAAEALARVVAAPARAVLGPSTHRLGRSVVVVPVRGIEAIAGKVAAATAAVGQPDAGRPFAGHLTVARARGRRSVPARLGGLAVSGAWEVRELALVRSLTARGGARYETVARHPLRQGP